jgi:hypothetical protein
MSVLDPQALDHLGRRSSRLWKLFAHPLAQRRRERVDLPHARLPPFARTFNRHAAIEPKNVCRVCVDSVANCSARTSLNA